MKEQSIRVSARGEFAQLQRGLKDLKKDFGSVLGEIDKGARKGGVFDDTQLRALDVYRSRFKATMDALNKEFEKQNEVIDKLERKKEQASVREQSNIQKQINAREKELDVIRRQLLAVEKSYEARQKEASTYKTTSSTSSGGGGGVGSSGSSGGSGGGGGGVLGAGISKLFGGAKFLAALAGFSGIASLASEAYSLAYQSQVSSLDLAQRLRGGGYGGSAKDMWDTVGNVGRSNRMGYTSSETWGFMDAYTREAGAVSQTTLKELLQFGRGYGLSTQELAGSMSGMREIGGTTSPTQFADMIAASISKSGMTPRILEVMETSAGLLANMSTTLKDTGAKQILAYQTTLDTLGNKHGMMKLTGAQGANIISGLGGIYDPNADNWKYMGIQALQRYDPQKYGNMDMYGLERTFEDGLLNPDNLPAMSKYLKESSGGNVNVEKRMIQRWLQDGGYNATKRQVDELYDVTDGFNAFSEEKMAKVMKDLTSGDATAAYQDRVTEIGQNILDVNARYEKALETAGQPLLMVVTDIKEGFTGLLEWFTNNEKVNETLDNIYEFLKENWKTLATVGAVAALGILALKGLAMVAGVVWNVGKFLLPFLVGRGGGDVTAAGAGKGGKDKDGKSKEKKPGWWDKLKGSAKNAGKGVKPGSPQGMALGVLLAGAAAFAGSEALDLPGYMDEQKAENNTQLRKNFAKQYGISTSELAKMMEKHDVSNLGLRMGKVDPKVAKMIKDIESLKDIGDINLSELNMTGTEMFTGLNDIGDEMFTSLFEDGTGLFEDLKDFGLEEFEALNEDGALSLDNLYKDGSGFLEGVFKEHEGFKDFFASLWADFMSIMEGGFGTSSGGYGGTYDASVDSGVSAATLNSQLGGLLKGRGEQFIAAGKKYGVDPALLAAIAMQETGNGSSNALRKYNNAGGIMTAGGSKLRSFNTIEESIFSMADMLKRLYIDEGLTSVEAIQAKYAPSGAKNDPNGLNNYWVSGVNSFLSQLGVSGNSSGGVASGGIWSNWQSNITSRYGDTKGRTKVHEGLDIDGKHGDKLTAVTGGQIMKIVYDDGSKRDPDGKANSTAGGNQVWVKMADGSSYVYSHLSQINSSLKTGQAVNAGAWLGNMGGLKGYPGSGYSTTGDHLHLGLYDKNMKSKDPLPWLRNLLKKGDAKSGGGRLDKGDLDILETFGSAATGINSLDLTSRSLGDAMNYVSGNTLANAGAQRIEVDVNLAGDVASLNNATSSQLERLVRKVVQEVSAERLRLNPTTTGWA